MNFWTVGAFSDWLFSGNRVAVYLVQQFPTDTLMQQIAAEMNLSETAFVQRLRANHFHIRWFTPAVEVNLCGHATLATGHILRQEQQVDAQSTVTLESRSGPLLLHYDDARIIMDFPVQPTQPATPPDGLIEAIGVTPIAVHRALDDWLIECASESDVRVARPNFSALIHVECRGVIITARAEKKTYDIVSRFFAPRVGVNEDPVTGSAHCKLIHYWSERLQKNSLTAYQASRRGGTLHLQRSGDRVLIGGAAVTAKSGTLALPTVQ